MLDIRIGHGCMPAILALLMVPCALHAQAPAAAARQLGTVKAVAGNTVTLTTSAGAEVTVTVAPDAPVLQLPPGSTDLKAATPAKLEDVAVGDRILASGKAGDTAATLTATRVILMKSTDIAARNAAEQREWQRGLGGLVRTVNGPVVTVASGAKTLTITTTPTTGFVRYAADSVSFTDVQSSTLAAIHPGDQLRARGTVADDRMSMTADAVVTGTFENLSGVISAVDASAQTLTLKDLATKKMVTVAVTAKSDLRQLPPQAAAAFAARNAGGGGAGAGARPAGGTGGSGAGVGTASGAGAAGAGSGGGAGASGAGAGAGRARNAGFDLSQMLSRLPTQTIADLKPGEAVMIVASPGTNGSPTAITLLSGVEQILSATPSGQQPITLSPWNLGAVPEGGGEGGGTR